VLECRAEVKFVAENEQPGRNVELRSGREFGRHFAGAVTYAADGVYLVGENKFVPVQIGLVGACFHSKFDGEIVVDIESVSVHGGNAHRFVNAVASVVTFEIDAHATVQPFQTLFVKSRISAVSVVETRPLVAIGDAHPRGDSASRKTRVHLQRHRVELGKNRVLCGGRKTRQQEQCGENVSHSLDEFGGFCLTEVVRRCREVQGNSAGWKRPGVKIAKTGEKEFFPIFKTGFIAPVLGAVFCKNAVERFASFCHKRHFHHIVRTECPAIRFIFAEKIMRLLCLFPSLIFLLPSLFSQKLTDARLLHVPDSGVLTAGALDEAGHLYLASTLNLKNTFGQNGILGLFPAGDPVLSKYSPDGTLLWRREFPGNIARICDAALTPDGGLVITGGYVDTFRLAPDWLIPGTNEYDASFFIAKLDGDGNFQWIDVEVSMLPEDCLGWTLAVSQDAIYVGGMYDAEQSSLRRYDFDGTLRAQKILDIRSISDLALDNEGNLYAVGTASPWAMFANLPVPEPPIPTSYASYVARLDSTLTAHWIRAYNYITFDEHPKVAVFDDKVFFLSNDFVLGPNESGFYRLKVFTPDGDFIWADGVFQGNFPAFPQHFVLQPFCDRLLVEFISGDGMALKSYDSAFSDSLHVQSSEGNFDSSFPFICANKTRAIFGSNFRNATLDIDGNFSLQNQKTPGYQQFILELECSKEPSDVTSPTSGLSLWSLAPNPAATATHLRRHADNTVRNAHAELRDMTGLLHWSGKIEQELTPIPVENLPPGIYFLQITAGDEVVTLKGLKSE